MKYSTIGWIDKPGGIVGVVVVVVKVVKVV